MAVVLPGDLVSSTIGKQRAWEVARSYLIYDQYKLREGVFIDRMDHAFGCMLGGFRFRVFKMYMR